MTVDLEQRRREFEALALEHMCALYNTALKLTRNELDAEDLVQETYLKAFRFFDKFQRGTNFKAWIFKILMNSFINKYRKDSRAPQRVEFDKVEYFLEHDASEEPTKFRGTYDESLYSDLFDDVIQEALDRLPEDFRTVVLLSDIEGFSYKEIAQIVGCPLGTVMSRLSRGRHLLRRQLAGYAREQGYVKTLGGGERLNR